jgi:uncharacterized protein YjgD (DUF1641 family)
MARPIQTVVHVTPDPQAQAEQALLRLLQTLAADAEALEDALRVIRGLHERGLLELTAAILEQGDEVLRIVVEQLSQPGAVKTLQNVVALAEQLGKLDLQKVGTLVEGATRGMEEATAAISDKPLGMFGLLRALSDPDISAGLQALLGALKGLGRALRKSVEEG